MISRLFSRNKFDGVVEAVHYNADGSIDWVRAYERRGPTWSDRVLIDRDKLVARLAAGKRFYTGKRRISLASEFDLSAPLRLLATENGHVLVTGGLKASEDQLAGVPVI